MSTIANLTVALNADVGGFTGAMGSATRAVNAFKKMGQSVYDSTRTPLERYEAGLRKVNALYRSGSIDLNTYGRSVAQLKREMDAAAGAAKRLSVQQQAMSGVSRLAKTPIGFGPTAIAALAAGGVAKHSVGLASDFEATSIAMEVLMKDVKASKALIEDLYQYAAKTPFEFPEVTAAAKQLLGFGVAAKNILPTIERLGNLSSGLNIPLGELANLFGRNRNQAHIFSRDINEFTSRGIPIIQQLAKQFNVATADVMGLVEKGKVGFKDVEIAIAAMTDKGGQFAGMTDRLSTSMKGLASTAKDDVNSALRALGDYIGPTLIPMISDAAKTVKNLADELKGLEHTNVGKSIDQNAARLATKNATATPFDTLGQIRKNIEEQKRLIEERGKIAAALQKRSNFNPLDLAAIPQDLSHLEALSRQLNALARERAMLERLLKTQGGAGAKGAADEVRRSLNEGVEGAAKSAAGALDYLRTAFNDAFNAGMVGAKGLSNSFREFVKDSQLIKDLQIQVDTFGMSARAAQLYKAQLDKLPEPILAVASALSKQLDELEANRDAMEESRRTAEQFDRDVKELIRQNETPLEKFNREMQRISELREHGLSDEQFRREADRLKKELDESEKRGTGQQRVGGAGGALVAGTSGFYSAIARSLSGQQLKAPPATKEEKQIAATLKRMEVLERQQAKKRPQILNFVN